MFIGASRNFTYINPWEQSDISNIQFIPASLQDIQAELDRIKAYIFTMCKKTPSPSAWIVLLIIWGISALNVWTTQLAMRLKKLRLEPDVVTDLLSHKPGMTPWDTREHVYNTIYPPQAPARSNEPLDTVICAFYTRTDGPKALKAIKDYQAGSNPVID